MVCAKCKLLNILLMLAIFLSASTQSYGQGDLSNGQKAPAGVKVDGKLNEWGALPRYNKSTLLHYTVANDANHLYLAFSSSDATTINKILGGGITVTINKDGKKRDKDAAVIQYPLAASEGMRMFRGNRQSGDATDTAALIASRKQSITAFKEIGVSGIKDITDSLISIYNTYGLKVVTNVDAKADLVYELAVPFKLIELSAGNATEIALNVKINGLQFNGNRIMANENGGTSGGRQGGFDVGSIRITGGGQSMMEMTTPTDFWIKYKLAKL
jgi:hypothetical protein